MCPLTGGSVEKLQYELLSFLQTPEEVAVPVVEDDTDILETPESARMDAFVVRIFFVEQIT